MNLSSMTMVLFFQECCALKLSYLRTGVIMKDCVVLKSLPYIFEEPSERLIIKTSLNQNYARLALNENLLRTFIFPPGAERRTYVEVKHLALCFEELWVSVHLYTLRPKSRIDPLLKLPTFLPSYS